MSFELDTDVILTSDVQEHHLRAGDVGTVVEHHRVPAIAGGHSVKFFDMIGNTVAVVTVPANALRLPTPTDRRPQHPGRGRHGNPGFGALINEPRRKRFLWIASSSSSRSLAKRPSRSRTTGPLGPHKADIGARDDRRRQGTPPCSA